MGRRTWESLPPRFRPLPDRTNVVITSNPYWSAPGAVRAGSLEEALKASSRLPGSEQVWVIGAGTVYREALALAGTASVTRIDADVEGDTYAPVLGPGWVLKDVRPGQGWHKAANGTRYRIETWQAGH